MSISLQLASSMRLVSGWSGLAALLVDAFRAVVLQKGIAPTVDAFAPRHQTVEEIPYGHSIPVFIRLLSNRID